MPTLGQIETSIRRKINRGTEYDDAIREAIVDAVDLYKVVRFRFNTGRATTTISLNDEYICPPADFLEVDWLRLTDDQDRDPMIEVTTHWIEAHRVQEDYRSRPEKYTVENKEIRLWPVSDGSYGLTINYVKQIDGVSLSASAGVSNAWTNQAGQLIKYRAIIDVLEEEVGGEEARAQARTYYPKLQAKLAQLKKEAQREAGSDRLRPWS